MIGVFDSGSGGLTVLAAIRQVLPDIGAVYFGDIAHAPYGEKDSETLLSLTKKGIKILKQAQMTHLVSACNSVSAAVLMGAADTLPFVEMSVPTAQYLVEFAGQRFLLLATPATIASQLYEHAVHESVIFDDLPLPGLAGAIEFGAPLETMRAQLQHAFSTSTGERYDGVILGCTHYPLIRSLIQEEILHFFGSIPLIDPAYFVAQEVKKKWPDAEKGSIRFLISQLSPLFEKKVQALFGDTTYSIEVVSEGEEIAFQNQKE